MDAPSHAALDTIVSVNLSDIQLREIADQLVQVPGISGVMLGGSFHTQVGHPLGVPDFAYAGEVALGVILADPRGELGALQQMMAHYLPRLSTALVAQPLWEAEFLVAIARKVVARGDATYVAGCLFRHVPGVCLRGRHGCVGAASGQLAVVDYNYFGSGGL